ncbi:uncharacterized protein LOC122531983 isoform X2 [Frieseomelitta varia]|uniref:uncharacterized protein LOC122531983 isoform X2 n=1 Tax=Frieseomelitta varia TaxID=561572 RepID=UPI001CB69BBD|nr:uncharacterized protein LOC122531983 isoform X2 [Frieseomelitta varia]
MCNAEELMTDIYYTLLQIRYPKITTVVANNVEITILSGENRLSLLSWLLTEKSPQIASKFQKLKGAALEEELLRSYSEIGICTDKKLLLGNCPLKEQLPTLRLLLDFMKCLFLKSSDTKCNEKESIDDILNVYINEDPNTFMCNIEPKLSYFESMQYFENLQSNLNKHQESSPICKSENEEHVMEQVSENEKEANDHNLDSLFNEEKKNFMEAYSSVDSWLKFNMESVKNNSYSMDADIDNIYTNFSSLIQFLQAKEEILNANIPKEIKKLNTPLNEIIGNTVTHTEEATNICIDT